MLIALWSQRLVETCRWESVHGLCMSDFCGRPATCGASRHGSGAGILACVVPSHYKVSVLVGVKVAGRASMLGIKFPIMSARLIHSKPRQRTLWRLSNSWQKLFWTLLATGKVCWWEIRPAFGLAPSSKLQLFWSIWWGTPACMWMGGWIGPPKGRHILLLTPPFDCQMPLSWIPGWLFALPWGDSCLQRIFCSPPKYHVPNTCQQVHLIISGCWQVWKQENFDWISHAVRFLMLNSKPNIMATKSWEIWGSLYHMSLSVNWRSTSIAAFFERGVTVCQMGGRFSTAVTLHICSRHHRALSHISAVPIYRFTG